MSTFKAISRYSKEEKTYRFATLTECKNLSDHAQVKGRDGRIANVKITSVKTWKTRPAVKVGWKFGLYEYGQELITEQKENDFFVLEVTE